eukprot:4379925-Prymnesium_polylepis.2
MELELRDEIVDEHAERQLRLRRHCLGRLWRGRAARHRVLCVLRVASVRARADVAVVPPRVGVVERVAPRARLAVGVAAEAVAAQPRVREGDGRLGVVPRDLLRPRLALDPRLGLGDLAAVVLAVRLGPALARVVEAIFAVPLARL